MRTNKEKYKKIKDLENRKNMRVDVYNVARDGHKPVPESIDKVYPNTIIQRCLVHVKSKPVLG